jgi:hypothetical protein
MSLQLPVESKKPRKNMGTIMQMLKHPRYQSSKAVGAPYPYTNCLWQDKQAGLLNQSEQSTSSGDNLKFSKCCWLQSSAASFDH